MESITGINKNFAIIIYGEMARGRAADIRARPLFSSVVVADNKKTMRSFLDRFFVLFPPALLRNNNNVHYRSVNNSRSPLLYVAQFTVFLKIQAVVVVCVHRTRISVQWTIYAMKNRI